MKRSKGSMISLCISLLIVLGALAFMICDWALHLNVWTHPILNFLMVLCIGFGVMAFAFAIAKKSPWFFFLSAILLALVGLYITIQYLEWWLSIIIFVVVFVVFALFSLIVAGNKTENIAINESSDYKNYKQRKAEKEEMEKSEEPIVPEIKSFK